jgi:uncharacterized protein
MLSELMRIVSRPHFLDRAAPRAYSRGLSQSPNLSEGAPRIRHRRWAQANRLETMLKDKGLPSIATALEKVAAAALKLPIMLYRYTLKPFVGHNCRHLPTCSDYALEAIDRNGPWRGFWLTLSRLLRCHPWGTSGFDPVPDTRSERHPLWAPWRHGRWTAAEITPPSMPESGAGR